MLNFGPQSGPPIRSRLFRLPRIQPLFDQRLKSLLRSPLMLNSDQVPDIFLRALIAALGDLLLDKLFLGFGSESSLTCIGFSIDPPIRATDCQLATIVTT